MTKVFALAWSQTSRALPTAFPAECSLCGCPAGRHRENGDGFVACRTFGCACLHYWPGV